MKLGSLTGSVLVMMSALAQSVSGCGGSVDENGNGSGGNPSGGSSTGGAAGSTGGVPGGGGAPGGSGGAETGGYPSCFAAGTPIATPRGEIAIEQLSVGDLVLAYDEERHAVVSRPVVRTFVHPDQKPGRLVLADGHVLQVTDNHPIYLPDQNDYVAAGRVHGETRVLLLNGVRTRSGIAEGFAPDAAEGSQTVYNIEVAGLHNYFAGDVLVHNKSGGAPPCTYGLKDANSSNTCVAVPECLDTDPSTFEVLPGDAGTPTDSGTQVTGNPLRRPLCASADPVEKYAVAFEVKSPEPNTDTLTLISSAPPVAGSTGGAGNCSGRELGQLWTFHEVDAATNDEWQTLCTEVPGGNLFDELAVAAESPDALVRNIRFVTGCDCNLTQKHWNHCTSSYDGFAGASSCL